MSTYDDDDDAVPQSNRSMLMPALFSLLAFAVGAGVGTGITKSRSVEPAVAAQATAVPEAIDLDAACAPRVQESTAALKEATSKVDGLTAQIDAKLKEVSTLEAAIAKGRKAGSEQRRQLAAAKAELTELRAKLNSAETDKLNLTARVDSLTTNLTAREKELVDQKAATLRAETATVDASWSAFDRGAQIEICDKGNRKLLGKCRETVRSRIAKIENDYKACVRAGAATPTVKEANGEEELPQFSQWLGQEERATKGWYAMLCDPTLPEARAALDGASMIVTE